MMLRPRWRKILRELWLYRGRTTLVILSIAVGVFSVGMIASGWEILQREMPASYAAVNPASAFLYTEDFDDTLLQTIQRIEGVDAAVGVRTVGVQVQVGQAPAESGEVASGQAEIREEGVQIQRERLSLIALSSYEDLQINRLTSVEGAAIPAARSILIERDGLALLNHELGASLNVEMPDGRQRTLDFTGVVYDPTLDPTTFSGTINGFIDRETLPWLGEPRSYNQLSFTVSEAPLDRAHIQNVADEVRDKVQKAGVRVYVTWVPPPGEHPTYEIVQAVLFVLAALGIASLLVSSFLVINTVSSTVIQQTRQIGVMKALGADSGQLRQLYQGMVFLYAIIATLLAIPLAGLAAKTLTGYVAGLLNFDIMSYRVSPYVYGLELVVGLLTPLLASWWPIRKGSRMAIRDALDSRSAGVSQLKQGLVERLVGHWGLFSRPFLLAFRNTFRRKGRLILALATLTLGMAISIAIFTVYNSVQQTVNTVSQAWRYDATVYFEQNYLTPRVMQLLDDAPGVTDVEAWYMLPLRILKEDGRESDDIQVEASPATTTLFQPTLLAGRWLDADDEDGVVINTQVLDVEPGLQIGQRITTKINEREVSWEIVGIVAGTLAGPRMYIDYDAFSYVLRNVEQTNAVRLTFAPADDGAEIGNLWTNSVAPLESYLQTVGLKVAFLETTADVQEQAQFQFGILLIFLTIMAVLVLFVGGIGLTGTMSINVLERVSEIGVLRAIGASSPAVLRIFLTEGMVVGLTSWLLAIPLAWPLSQFLCEELGLVLIQTPLVFQFSLMGLLISLVFIILVAGAATFFPARSATKLSVRETLSYE